MIVATLEATDADTEAYNKEVHFSLSDSSSTVAKQILSVGKCNNIINMFVVSMASNGSRGPGGPHPHRPC